MMKFATLAIAIVTVATVGAAGTASARPHCDGPFSLDGDLRGRYCKSEYLARVAADHGLHVTGAVLRNRHSEFEITCKLVGNDIRVNQICGQGSLGNPLLCTIFSCN